MSVEVYANGMEIACKAASGKSAAATPDTCLTPPPPPGGPQPIPYPNTASASDTTNGTKTVMIVGQEVMMQDQSTFKTSTGDEAATKSQGMGVVTHTIQGEASFVKWSMDVKFEDACVDRHLDLMIHNEQSNPANTPTMAYVSQAATGSADKLKCGELGNYGEQKGRSGDGKYDRDHIPSKAALKERARQLNGNIDLTPAQARAIDNGALSVVIPKAAHQQVSPTYGGRNSSDTIQTDAGDLSKAAKDDTDAMLAEIDNHADPECAEAYRQAAAEIASKTNDDYDEFLNKVLDMEELQ